MQKTINIDKVFKKENGGGDTEQGRISMGYISKLVENGSKRVKINPGKSEKRKVSDFGRKRKGRRVKRTLRYQSSPYITGRC